MDRNAATGRVAVVGSANTDFVVSVDRLPGPGETLLGGAFFTAAGGKGANQAVAAARAGAAVTFIARLGDDDLGRKALDGFRADGIDVRSVEVDACAPSGVAFVLVDRTGENCIVVAPGANARLSPEQLAGSSAAVRDADVCLLQLETPLDTVARALQVAHDAGVRTVLNPAPARELGPEHLNGLFLLTPNESETELLTGIRPSTDDKALRSVDILMGFGVRNVVVTRGADGSLLAGEEGTHRIPTLSIQPVDTTAAGDAFNGALAAALSRGESLVDACRFASCAGALAATRKGAQPSIPYRGEILAALRRLP